MDESLDALTYESEEDGTLVRKQLDRVILTHGAWATVLFLFQAFDPKSGSFHAPRAAVVRFQKVRGSYRKRSAFTVSNEAQARELVSVFERWAPRMATETAADPDSEDVLADDDARRDADGYPGP